MHRTKRHVRIPELRFLSKNEMLCTRPLENQLFPEYRVEEDFKTTQQWTSLFFFHASFFKKFTTTSGKDTWMTIVLVPSKTTVNVFPFSFGDRTKYSLICVLVNPINCSSRLLPSAWLILRYLWDGFNPHGINRHECG